MSGESSSGLDWTTVDAVIFDVDGTLFDHTALRRPMAARMLVRFATGRLSWRDIQTVRLFRSERTRLALASSGDIGSLQFERVAALAKRPRQEVETIVRQWIYQEPLDFVARYAFPDASCFVTALGRHCIRTGVFSDYPAHGKLEALGIAVDVVRDATDPDVGRLKPDPYGFLRVAELLRVSPQRCLIVGDRDDRDGEAARRGGFMFLKKVPAGRLVRTREFDRYGSLIPELERGRAHGR